MTGVWSYVMHRDWDGKTPIAVNAGDYLDLCGRSFLATGAFTLKPGMTVNDVADLPELREL